MKEEEQTALFCKQLLEYLRPLHKKLSPAAGKEISIHQKTQLPLALSLMALAAEQKLLVLLPNEAELKTIERDLQQLKVETAVFDSWGISALRGIASRPITFARRSILLAQLLKKQPAVLLCSFDALATVLAAPEQLKEQIISLEVGKEYDLATLETQLSNMGYLRVPRVTIAGEFALRGEVIDLFPPEREYPCRLRFAFEQLEEISSFDTVNQRSFAKKYSSLLLAPLKEISWNNEQLEQLEENILELGIELNAAQQQQLSSLHQGLKVVGEELLFALAHKKGHSLLDYLSQETCVVFGSLQKFERQHTNLVEQFVAFSCSEVASERILPTKEQLFPSMDALKEQLQSYARIIFDEFAGEKLPLEQPFSCHGNLAKVREQLASLSAQGFEIHVGASSQAQAQRLAYLFRETDYKIESMMLSCGFILPQAKIAMLQEHEILKHQLNEQRQRELAEQSSALDSLFDLEEGDYVVHINHGIGRFRAIERLKSRDAERDYIALEFADDTSIFVPIEQLDLLQRYIGSSGNKPKLDKVGGISWQKRKSRTMHEVQDLADKLLRLYARRSSNAGFAFPAANDLQIEFEADFPYQETSDQLQASAEILQDMEKEEPMDRLLCGDVGFGKTEVAMRACFKAVQAGKQVAFLCPTTILAEQHSLTFLRRFQRFPVKIACLSRLIAPKEQKRILHETAQGEIDILIGTHRILSADVRFKDLGLLVIDEEQRFGVKSKEKLKQLKTAVDCLTLSATPIPRTLHMSLLEIRAMSVLNTPPTNRHPIETTVQKFDSQKVTQAIRQELERGGQIFYLHNRIETLEERADLLRQLVPEALIETAHGQMPVKQLESIMHRFVNNTTQILLTTTIIENGIDIPNANTMIIDRADQHGVAQLYQLRGRVGRSDRIAYAYLFYPNESGLSEIAIKRLNIISDFNELGSGFKVAIRDLEVRGAGNLLGAQQTGQIAAVGFELYVKLLNEAIHERRYHETQAEKVKLELEYSGFIPDSYIPDAYEKMEIYQRMNSITTSKQLSNFYEELHDRFGALCEQMAALMNIAELRVLCYQYGITAICERRGQVSIQFQKNHCLNVDKLLKAVVREQKRLQLSPEQHNLLLYKFKEDSNLIEKGEQLRNLLQTL